MKRRNFLKLISSLLPAAIVAKEVVEAEPTKEEVMAEWETIKPRLDNQTMTYTYGTSAFLGTYTYFGKEPVPLDVFYRGGFIIDAEDVEQDEP